MPFKERESEVSLLRGHLSKAGQEVPLYTYVSLLSCYHERSVSCFTKGHPPPFFPFQGFWPPLQLSLLQHPSSLLFWNNAIRYQHAVGS